MKQKILAEIESELSLIIKDNLYDEGRWNELNHLKIFINSLPEEPEFTSIEKEVANAWTVRIDRKRIPITLKGDIKAKFRNEFHTMWQTVGEMQFANVAKAIMERLCLHFAAWGSYNLKDLGVISKKEKAKMDISEEPVSEDLEEASYKYACKCNPLRTEYGYTSPNPEVKGAFKAGAKWERERFINKACELS